MTCDEFHAYWEMHPDAAVRQQSNPGELSEHLSDCVACTRFMKEETEVGKCLLIMRSAAPHVPASLDASVRARYRAFVRDQSRASRAHPLPVWAPLRGALRCALAFGFAAVVAYGGVLLLFPRQASRIERHITKQPTIASRTALPVSKEKVVRPGPTPKRRRSIAASRQKSGPPWVTGQDAELPTSFQSLMYCDPFSCSGAMDVIRLRLPSPVFGTTPSSGGVGSRVSAEVLVGPDGIARGIRVVE
jgi:hypothetical protein